MEKITKLEWRHPETLEKLYDWPVRRNNNYLHIFQLKNNLLTPIDGPNPSYKIIN